MKSEITKISIDDLTYEKFVSDFLIPEIPLVIQGLANFDLRTLTPEFILKNYTDENKREAGWFDADLVDNEVIKIPSIVKSILNRDDMSVRQSPMRLFMQPAGHVTLPHYDGNSLHGLNQQITGKKRWIITSPNTPLPNIPFMFAGLVGENFTYSESEHDYMDFTTHSGDMLFLPRYWYHEVHSLEKINLNMNWVFTPNYPNQSSKLGRREVEIVKLRDTLPIINKIFFPDKFTNYGGQGTELINAYCKDVSKLRMMKRFLIELLGYPRLLLLAKQIKKRANEFSNNNFNIN
ncbi:cupin-like domain-containing protein [Paraglaciecola aquimarina]|uniref:Cupin-like domain-containing protein n=1 Tax=Paraglaciecola algarum TaxID=3050085 RepID=A0ABS9D6U2_9ALTE|nr:cupin-like domain-containing protein [Paraglaciecola sp. G1-23]MCF2947737.1 cupin-like domain-containing protein [Paraglaciecola sp. G1-23]